MPKKPTYEELEQRIQELEQAESELKTTDNALRESEKLFRTSFENAATGMALMANDGYFLKVNPTLCKILGYSEEELLSKTWVEITEPDDLDGCFDWLKRIKAGDGSAYEKRFIHKLGHQVWIMVSSSLVRDSQGKIRYYISLFQDIMSRKQAEDKLKKRVKELNCFYGMAALLELPDISLDEILKRTVVLIPPAWQFPKITAARIVLDEQSFQTKNFRETSWMQAHEIIVHGKTVGQVEVCYLEERQASDEGSFMIEERHLLNTIAERLGKIIERMKAKGALRESEEKYRSLVDSTNDWVWACDIEGRQTFANEAVKTILGYDVHEIEGILYENFIHPEDQRNTKQWLKSSIEKKKGWKNSILRWKRKDGSIRFLESTARPVLDSEGNLTGFIGIDRDITKRKQAEEALKISRENLLEESNQRKILSKKLIELLEKDRHYIAMELHDNIGQILTSLKINLEILDDKLKPADTEFRFLVKTARRRAKQVIDDLNIISQGLMPGILDALGLVSSLRTLLNEVKENTDIKIKFFNRNVPKRFDKEKELAIYRIVQEALNNIIKHAKAKNVYVSLLNKGNVLFLSVEDDGVGFDKNKAMKISKGKGPLGLIIMQERAMQLDGELTVESSLGKGTHLLAEIPI